MSWLDFFKFKYHLGTSSKPRPLPQPKDRIENDWEIPLRNYLQLRTDYASLCKDYTKALEDNQNLQAKLRGIKRRLEHINWFDNVSGVIVITEHDFERIQKVLESLKNV